MSKLVVFTGDLSYSVRKGILEIDRAQAGLEWLIVLVTPRKTIRQLLRSQWRNLDRNGWRWIPYQLSDVAMRIRQRWRSDAGTNVESSYSVRALASRSNVKILRVDNIHAPTTLTAVSEFAPDLGLSMAAPILRRPLFAIPKLGTINLHKGKVPTYRGMPPAFWEMWNDEQSVGCTIHWVDDKLDTGNLVAEATVQREKYSTVRGLQLRLDEVGIALMRAAVTEIVWGGATSMPQPEGGRTYRKPTLKEIGILKRKLRKQMPIANSATKQMLKDAYSATVFACSRCGLHRALKPRITVLLYHRVSDAARDNLTVGVEQFDRQMDLLREHCEILSIEDVLASESIGSSKKPRVCVTFDDGYLDNYEYAAPILQRHGIPAAFFVSTGIVASENRFPHDVRRGNAPIPVMQWHQLREMHANGFTIGSHSVNHIDCASEPKEKVWNELVISRQTLERELGLKDVIFAYPYGGRQHMTPERLELVKQAGYIACLSAYGGTNIGAVDRFNVLRRGIHWGFSDRAFLVECLGLA